MRVAAYQAPLASVYDRHEAIALVRAQVAACETAGVALLCCPEAMLGGLADYVERPADVAVHRDALGTLLAPLASDGVTTVLGFTEIDDAGTLYNAAAVLRRGAVAGVYRKLHPAIRRSVYAPGRDTPVFTVGALAFGIVICRDSTFAEPARAMAAQGARVLLVPSNNGMPLAKGGAALIDEARACDAARAAENGVFVVRADVAGRWRGLASHGATGIMAPDGRAIATAQPLASGLIVAEIRATPLDGASTSERVRRTRR